MIEQAKTAIFWIVVGSAGLVAAGAVILLYVRNLYGIFAPSNWPDIFDEEEVQ
jgi:hypothetical protein